MNYHNITKDDLLNGNGIRVVLWVAGCMHHCPGCQNPITWNPYGGIKFDENAEKELFEYLSKDYIDGITFSGGDPLYSTNLGEIYQLAKKVKELNKTIWIYTGYTWEEIFESNKSDMIQRQNIIRLADVLVDGKFEKEKLDVNYHWAGSTNQRVIDVQKSLAKNKIILLK